MKLRFFKLPRKSSGPSLFPHSLFRWFVGQQVLTLALAFFGLYFVSLFWFSSRTEVSPEALEWGKYLILLTLGLAFVVTVAVSLFMGGRLVVPLGRLIEKTKRLREFPFEAESLTPAELAYDEPGEWYELERALNQLGTDLRQKTIRLSREKTELRAIMSAISEAVLAVDLERRPLFFNPQCALLFDLHGRADGQVHLQEIIRSPEIVSAYDRALIQDELVRVEADLPLKDSPFPQSFQISIAPLRKKHNAEVYGAVGIFHDITDLKKTEQIRIDFVGNVSHELRTPVTSLKGYIEALNEDIKAGDLSRALEYGEILEKSVGRLALLVDDLLDLSSLESGAELSLTSVSPRELTESVIEQLSSQHHEIHLHYGVDSIQVDRARFEQVVRNLLHNAIRYVPQGGRIDVTWTTGENDMLVLKVKDNGPGIPPEHHERLFERFYRVDKARSRDVGGTGIGLALVKHIVQRHGGRVWVQSAPGKGSEFICEIPGSPL